MNLLKKLFRKEFFIVCNTYKKVSENNVVLAGSLFIVGTKSDIYAQLNAKIKSLPSDGFVADFKVGRL